MPIITVDAAKITKENKAKLITSLTKTASEITSIPESSFTVLIKEFPVENWGIGGEPLEEIIKKMNPK
ncbi:MAG: tautomerase family protein [Spirochaetes bacterium]|nr:tautomerase family protein [Spirochaetota bacterium]